MCKKTTSNALRLKEYIEGMDDFRFIEPDLCAYSDHIGALLTDAILQAGLNYRNVVWPRVSYVLTEYPEADTISSFSMILKRIGTSQVLRWNNADKIQRMEDLVNFCIKNHIDTTVQLAEFLTDDSNVESMKTIRGIGDKTCDYLKRLLGFDVVAVDRNIRSFIEKADIQCQDYSDVQQTVEYAADFLACSRRALDYSIWSYMSHNEEGVLEFSFDYD